MHRAAAFFIGMLLVWASAVVSAQQTTTTVTTKSSRLLPGTRPGVLTTVQGTAISSTNGPLADIPVRLRDVRFGRVVDTVTTDKAGAFAFHGVEPGSYVVELMGNDSTILAASQVLNVEAGSIATAIVKMPFKFPPFGGLVGHSLASAVAVSTAAAAAGVLAVKVTACVSPPCQ